MKRILTRLSSVSIFQKIIEIRLRSSLSRPRNELHRRSALLFCILFFLFLGTQQSCERRGVPEGERTSVIGAVQDVNGKPIAGIDVHILNLDTGVLRTTRTDPNGNFETSGLPPGKYKIRADVFGVPSMVKEITLIHGQTANVILSRGPVPEGERNESKRTVEVIESTFNDEITLQRWINGNAERGKRLRGIVSIKHKTSLFLVESSDIGTIGPDLVYRVNQPLRSDDLLAQFKLHPDKTFLGIHRLDDKSYLMVWRYGR